MPYPNLPFDWANRFERTIGGGESGYDAQAAADEAYPVPPVPQMAPQSRFQSGLDAASLAVLQQLQNMPRPSGFGAGLAQGFAGGLAQTRAERVAEKKAAFESERANRAKQVERNAAAKFTAGRDLARRRWDMVREQQRGGSGDDAWTDLTDPAVQAWAKENRIALPPGATRAKTSQLIRQLPADREHYRDPVLDELARFNLDQKKRDASQRESDIESAAQDLADKKLNPLQVAPRDPDRGAKFARAQQILEQRGEKDSIQSLEAKARAAQNFMSQMDKQRFIMLRQAAITVNKHLNQLEDYYKDFGEEYDKRMKSTPAWNVNEWKALRGGMLQYAANGGLGPDAAERANALLSTVGPVSREAALVFSSGFAPLEKELKEGHDALSAAVGPRGHKGQLRAMRSLLKARVGVASSALPYAGGRDNPYLLEVSPIAGWEDADKEHEASKAPERGQGTKAGGKAGRYSQ